MSITMQEQQPNTPSSPSSARTRNSRFYFDDRLVVFEVEDELFRVPARHFASHSPIFHDMFNMPPPFGERPEGESDDKPIVLKDEKAEDFAVVLSWFHKDIVTFEETKENWIAILGFAHKYLMNRVQETAVSELSDFDFEDPFEKLRVCELYDVDLVWASDAIKAICTRSQSIALKEGRMLSQDLLIALAAARDSRESYVINNGWGASAQDVQSLSKKKNKGKKSWLLTTDQVAERLTKLVKDVLSGDGQASSPPL